MKKRMAKGDGSIFYQQSKKLWVGRITLPDGRKKEKYAKTQKLVLEWLTAQRSTLQQGLMPKDDHLTVSTYLTNYMDTVGAHTLRPKTIEAYAYLIRMHIVPVIGKIKLSALRPDHLQSLYSQKLESGLSNRTVQFIHGVLHKALQQALRWGLVVRNVADLVDAPRVKRKSPQVFTPEQVHKFLESTKGDRFSCLYYLAVYCGFREGELLGIHRSDIHGDTITVNHAVQYLVGKGVVITEPKTDRSRRSVTVPKTALKVLGKYLSTLRGNQGLIFTTASGKPINPRFLIKSFKEALRVSGLPDIPFHALRHTSASLALSAGVNIKAIQEKLGHSSITLTLDTYSHIMPGMQKEAADKLDKFLTPPYFHSTG